MGIVPKVWRDLLNACSHVSQQAGRRQEISQKPPLLRRTIEAVSMLNEVAKAAPARFSEASRSVGCWPVLWVDEMSARRGFSEQIDRLQEKGTATTSPADRFYYDQICESVAQLTIAATEDPKRYAPYLDPCGWPTLLKFDEKRPAGHLPKQPKVIAMLADEAEPRFRIYRGESRNSVHCRIDLGSPANCAAGFLFGIAQILWKAKRMVAFDNADNGIVTRRIDTALAAWESKNREPSVARSCAGDIMKSLSASYPDPTKSDGFAIMLDILHREVAGPGMIRELRPLKFRDSLAPSAREVKRKKLENLIRPFHSASCDSKPSIAAKWQTEDSIRRAAKKTLKQAMNWI
ncbi:MAG TPA: hypothetical protein PLS03_11985 [Terrimicrobiaceae bacterium]|nr:hypothetical protein [Terrimicrobiaceae bacterium]